MSTGLALMPSHLKLYLYLMCGLTDFASFAVVFAVSRGLAEGRAAPWYLGLVGAGLSFSAAVGSVLGGWLASRFDGRIVFVSGAKVTPVVGGSSHVPITPRLAFAIKISHIDGLVR